MSKHRLAALGALAAMLAAAGVAVAAHRAQSTQQAAADFSASSVSRTRATTCTAGDGAYTLTTATYTGTAASGDARLNGPLEIRASSVVNTSTGLGYLQGTFRVRGSSGGATGTLHAAIAGGSAVGSVVGVARRNAGRLVASFSAGFSPGGGFSGGKLGSGSANGAGVFFTRGACTKTARLVSTAVFRLGLGPRQVVPPVSGLRASAAGTFTLDVTRDGSGTITGAKAAFSFNYRFPGAVTVTGLALHQGARGATGPVVLDAATGSIADPDGRGNVTKVVDSVPAATAQAILASPSGYYVELDTSANPAGALRAQLGRYGRR